MTMRVEEVSEVEIVLKLSAGKPADVRGRLRTAGLEITSEGEGVVKGTILADRLAEVERMNCVARVNVLLTYITDRVPEPAGGASFR